MSIKIENVNVYNFVGALDSAGLPMKATMDFPKEDTERLMKRGGNLGNVPIGSGHDKFLRGIVVAYRVTAPRFWYQEADTYHWLESISSQSTMHKITKMNLVKCMDVDVDSRVVDILQGYVDEYNANPSPTLFHKIKCNIPEGLLLARDCITNYQQLKTVYAQRKDHRLPEWRTFCSDFIAKLPCAKELGLLGKD